MKNPKVEKSTELEVEVETEESGPLAKLNAIVKAINELKKEMAGSKMPKDVSVEVEAE